MGPSTIAINDQWCATAYGVHLYPSQLTGASRSAVYVYASGRVVLSSCAKERKARIGPRVGIALGLEYEISWTRTPSLPSIDDLKMTHAHGTLARTDTEGGERARSGNSLFGCLVERGSRSGESSVLIRLRVDHPINPSPSPLSSCRHQCYHWDQTNLVEV